MLTEIDDLDFLTRFAEDLISFTYVLFRAVFFPVRQDKPADRSNNSLYTVDQGMVGH